MADGWRQRAKDEKMDMEGVMQICIGGNAHKVRYIEVDKCMGI